MEYFNIDLDNDINLAEPVTKKHNRGEAGLLSCCYKSSSPNPLTIISPPLRCDRVQVVPRSDPFSKCVIEADVTSNEWRFTQFLADLRDRTKQIITKNGKSWFGPAFSPAMMNDSYISLFLPNTRIYDSYTAEGRTKYSRDTLRETENLRHPTWRRDDSERIRIRLGKEIVKTLKKQQAREFRNQYLVFQLVFRGVLVENGIFTELWHANQVLKAKPISNEDGSSDEDDEFEDIDKVLDEPKKRKNNAKDSVSLDTAKDEDGKREKRGDNDKDDLLEDKERTERSKNEEENILPEDDVNEINIEQDQDSHKRKESKKSEESRTKEGSSRKKEKREKKKEESNEEITDKELEMTHGVLEQEKKYEKGEKEEIEKEETERRKERRERKYEKEEIEEESNKIEKEETEKRKERKERKGRKERKKRIILSRNRERKW